MTTIDYVKLDAHMSLVGAILNYSDESTDANWMRVHAAIEAYGDTRAAEEREACAELVQHTVCDVHLPTGIAIYGQVAARAIRARGDK